MKPFQTLLSSIIFTFLLSFQASSQTVVVNKYLNTSTPWDEWTQLLVTGDNVDMTGWTIRDNNSTQTSWQTPVTFNNVSLWQHLRRGTIITLWHRPVNSTGASHIIVNTSNVNDANADDGYIELDLTNSSYFTGGDLGNWSTSTEGNTMNLAGNGDIVELRDAGSNHVHGLGHKSTEGADWDNMPTPKLNHASSANDGDAIYACPGGTLSDYAHNISDILYTSRNNASINFGTNNSCSSYLTANQLYMQALREPDIAAQTVTPSSVVAGNPGSVTFSWTAATDPYPTDNAIGYMIVRNTVNTFALAPGDGKTYAIGAALATAHVIAEIDNSQITTYTDNTVANGNSYWYRVYAFRYVKDDNQISGYNVVRGRAYNQTNYVSVNWVSSPLPINLLYFNGKVIDEKVELKWTTSSELNNDYFTIERSTDGKTFEAIGEVKGAGNSTSQLNYDFDDNHPFKGISYYRLRQTDYDGANTLSKTIAINFNSIVQFDCKVYPNPFSDKIYLAVSSSVSGKIKFTLADGAGKILSVNDYLLNDGFSNYELNYSEVSQGIYLFTAETENNSVHLRVIKK